MRRPPANLPVVVLTTFVIALPLVYVSRVNGQPVTLSISASGPRPLYDTLNELRTRHGWLITYEDAYYDRSLAELFTGAEVVATRSRLSFRPGRMFAFPSVFNYSSDDAAKPEAVLSRLLESYNAVPNYQFMFVRQGAWFHVIPADRNADGTLTPRSRLDVRVTIPEAERSPSETITAVLNAVDRMSNTQIHGSIYINQMYGAPPPKYQRTGAQNEVARDVLRRALDATGRNISWSLLCDGLAYCALNFS
jgi:hypothetical protein